MHLAQAVQKGHGQDTAQTERQNGDSATARKDGGAANTPSPPTGPDHPTGPSALAGDQSGAGLGAATVMGDTASGPLNSAEGLPTGIGASHSSFSSGFGSGGLGEGIGGGMVAPSGTAPASVNNVSVEALTQTNHTEITGLTSDAFGDRAAYHAPTPEAAMLTAGRDSSGQFVGHTETTVLTGSQFDHAAELLAAPSIRFYTAVRILAAVHQA